jgi:thiol:disulfide interchange protein
MKFTQVHLGILCLLLVAGSGCSKSELKGTPGSDAEVTQSQVSEPTSTRAAFYTVDHYDNARNPADDLSTTIKRAQAEKKNILVQVGGDWCGWCHLMSTFIETNEKVRDTILANYLVMKVTEDADNKNTAFLSQYPAIPGYPHLFVLDTNGKLLHSQGTAELEQGHGYNETAYLEFLNKWKPLR